MWYINNYKLWSFNIMDPLINWQALQKLSMPPMPPHSVNGENMWDTAAVMYNKMAALEKVHTLNQINALPLRPTDNVLDMGCGSGRIKVPVAQRVSSVTAADSTKTMLDYCVENVKKANLTNVDPVFLDFNDAVVGKNIKKHDVVICSRSAGLQDLKKLSSFSDRIAAIVIWANAPSIPEPLEKLFTGTGSGNRRPRPGRNDRRVGYNLFYNIVYDLGYEPNVHVVDDGFTFEYASREEAYSDLSIIGEIDPDKMDVFQRNVDQFLTKNANGGYTFLLETRSAVIWWDVSSRIY